MIFVFGSNLAGIHGAGAARYAANNLGAMYGVGIGITGQCYALPTKDHKIRTMPLSRIEGYVNQFIEYAKAHPEQEFKITRVGCGLAGYKDSQVAPLFKDAPVNCYFDSAWSPWLGGQFKYWGTTRDPQLPPFSSDKI